MVFYGERACLTELSGRVFGQMTFQVETVHFPDTRSARVRKPGYKPGSGVDSGLRPGTPYMQI